MSTYLIGDIQGCCDALQRLLDKIRFDPAADRLWSCGDLVNRGGQSLQALRLLYGIRDSVRVTLGNHDLHLLAADHHHPLGDCRNREFAQILNAPDRQQLMDWLTGQPLARWSRKHQMLRVHAGVVPQWDRKQVVALGKEVSQVLQSAERGSFLDRMYGNKPNKWRDSRKGWSRLRLITNILTRIRFCDADGRALFKLTGAPGSQPEPYLPWFKHRHRQTRDVTMVFGHWAALGLKIKKRYIALDSGCVWGGKLSAVRLEDRHLFQVKGLKR
jgi:bis(5'-nucleosyl)-tetraphosphatase (symmetrical)